VYNISIRMINPTVLINWNLDLQHVLIGSWVSGSSSGLSAISLWSGRITEAFSDAGGSDRSTSMSSGRVTEAFSDLDGGGRKSGELLLAGSGVGTSIFETGYID